MAFHAVRERNLLLIIEFVSESHGHGIHISLKLPANFLDYSVIHKHLMRL